LLVVDFSALWAGPLCASVLRQCGCRIIKVEAHRRPDGSRLGAPAFFDSLNAGFENLSVDLTSVEDIALLRRLVGRADIVIEASRPRALAQLGIVAEDVTASSPTVWVSITGYGRQEPEREWVAFGDDAAVAGGLVVRDEEGPCFCADAIADPLAGLTASAAVLYALSRGASTVLDVALSRVAASFAGLTMPVPAGLQPSAPVPPTGSARGPSLGEHDESLRHEFS
jgi:crotonobetainyl-CoA:carnitine CoA-transferase CaiB-like acyl-CoA transferase